MKSITLQLSLALMLLTFLGCSDHGHDHAGEEPHGTQDDGHGDDDHGHGDHGAGAEVVTLWGEHTQLFVEFPALVVGQESPFAAHLTRMSDHLAIGQGTVVVELSGSGAAVERFSVESPSVAGIFRPVVKPSQAGRRQVTLRLDSSVASEVHEMGEFTVYPSQKAAEAAAADDEDDGAISYLLEQQWRVPFRLEKAIARPMRPNFPAFGRLIQTVDSEAVITAPRDGRVVAIGEGFPLVGDDLEAGAVLFRVTSAPREGSDPATLDLALEQATIGSNAARREVERLTPLVAQGVVAQRRLDEAASELASAEAAVRSARRRRGSLSQAQGVSGDRDALGIPAPINGTVAELFVAPGTWVSEGEPLARLVDRDRLLLSVGVPEMYVGRMREISGAWFTLDNVPGVIELPRTSLVSVGTEIDEKTRTLPVRFRLDNVRRQYFAGMTTLAHLISDEPRSATAVPSSALVDDAGMDVVYVQTGGESFERRPVRLGIRDGEWVEVTEGVAPDEWVVSVGAYSVKLASTSTESVGHGHAH